MKYVIDPETAEWVRRIFHWFVVERQSITWIVRELNARNDPKDHRASTPDWRHGLVTALLSRPKYVGVLIWGENRNVRDPETGVIRQEPRSEEETEGWVRHLPELQLTDLETFTKAQEFLDENEAKFGHLRDNNGQLKGALKDREAGHPLHLLSGLVKCGECGTNFVVGGTDSRYMFCPAYRRGTCSCKTQLKRELAERLILDVIGARIADSSDWTQAVIDASGRAWRERDARIPAELASIKQQIADVERWREHLLNRIENGHEIPELTSRLETRRRELKELRKQEESLQQKQNYGGEPPSETWLQEQLMNLGDVLTERTPAAAYALRDLVGGAITVHEVRREGRQRHRLKVTFTLQTSSLAESLGLTGSADPGCELRTQDQIEIAIVDPAAGAQAAEARRLYDQDLPNKEIANRLGVSRARVTALLKQSFLESGEVMPDGRSRRATLKHAHEELPKYIRIADEVMSLCDQGQLLGEIAEHIGCSRDLITKSVRWWHESRGLEVPDGRGRRKSLKRKSRSG